MNELKCHHEDPYVTAVVDHMIEVYRQCGCPLVGEEPPFDPIPRKLFDDRAIEIVCEAFAEVWRMGSLDPDLGGPAGFPTLRTTHYELSGEPFCQAPYAREVIGLADHGRCAASRRLRTE